MSITQLIMAALHENPGGLSAEEIVEAVLAQKTYSIISI